MDDIFGEEDALELDEEEIKKLTDVLQHSFNSLLRDRVVFTRTERAHKTLGQESFPDQLKTTSHCNQLASRTQYDVTQLTSERDVEELEEPAQKRKVSDRKDRSNNSEIGDGGSSWAFPLRFDCQRSF